MKTNWIYLVFLVAFITSCELFDGNDKQYQLDEIEQLEQEILALSESVSCTNSSEWKFTAMGSKACGGPTRYISFHQSLESKFMDLVNQYTKLQAEYNQKNNVFSDCMFVSPPKSVTCEAGKAILVY